VDPFFGEGIYYALRSGQLAAETVDGALASGKADLSGYDRSVREEIYPEFHAARKLGKLIYGAPRLFCAIVKDNRELGLLYYRSLGNPRGYQEFWNELKRKSPYVLWNSLKRRTWGTLSRSSGY
jgi:flavin-dependent dehydrogenase